LLARRKARTGLIPFTEYSLPHYETADHHRMIADRLEAVARGDLDRLMICMPPRHGKSELASKRFPAFFLGQNPRLSIIAASYGSDLAGDFGREVRNIVAGREFQAVFPAVSLAEDSRAANRWNTNAGGSYVAAGVGTAITGRGADVLLIDDPFKDRQDADSELQRQRVWDWYSSTAYTRLAPGGRIVIINTRWHEDDLSGRLLQEAERGGDQWEVLELPAIDDAGMALWPDRYPLDALERIRRALMPRDWAALYQQRPAPEEGDYYKRDWFRWYDEIPAGLRTYGASDYAVTERGGDYTVHCVVGIDADDNLFVLDIWREQTESHVWVETFLDMVEEHKPICWAEEAGQIIKSLGPFISRRQRERRVYCHRKTFPSVADKPTRCRSFQARASMGKVYLPRHAPWIETLMGELLTFNAGSKYDDQVDTLGLIGRMLDEMIGTKQPEPKPQRRSKWDRAFAADEGESWKTI